MVYRRRLLDLPKLAQAGVPVAADNDVVVQYHAERGGSLLDIFGHGDVGRGWGRIARGMIVHEDQRRGTELERAFDDLPGIDRRVVNGSALLALILDPNPVGDAIKSKAKELRLRLSRVGYGKYTEWACLAAHGLRGATADNLR